jgi:hypothetical protein
MYTDEMKYSVFFESRLYIMLLGVYFIIAHPTKSLLNTKYRPCRIIIGINT